MVDPRVPAVAPARAHVGDRGADGGGDEARRGMGTARGATACARLHVGCLAIFPFTILLRSRREHSIGESVNATKADTVTEIASVSPNS